jgi:hypothetical protein
MELNTSFKNKAGSNVVLAHSDIIEEYSRGLSFAITL